MNNLLQTIKKNDEKFEGEDLLRIMRRHIIASYSDGLHRVEYPQTLADSLVLYLKSYITQSRIKELEALVEIIEKETLCDYPKAKTQKEHEYNMKLINRAEEQAKEVIILILENVIKELKTN